MQANRYVIFRLLEEATKNEHDKIGWNKIVDTWFPLLKVGNASLPMVESMSAAIAIIGSQRFELYPTAFRLLCDWYGGPILYMKEEVLRFATIFQFRCELRNKDQNSLEVIVNMRYLLHKIISNKSENHLHPLRSEFNLLLDSISGFHRAEMKSTFEESIAQYPLKQFVPWFIKWGLDAICKQQAVLSQRYCGFKLSIKNSFQYYVSPAVQPNQIQEKSTDDFLSNRKSKRSRVTFADSTIYLYENTEGDSDDTPSNLHQMDQGQEAHISHNFTSSSKMIDVKDGECDSKTNIREGYDIRTDLSGSDCCHKILRRDGPFYDSDHIYDEILQRHCLQADTIPRTIKTIHFESFADKNLFSTSNQRATSVNIKKISFEKANANLSLERKRLSYSPLSKEEKKQELALCRSHVPLTGPRNFESTVTSDNYSTPNGFGLDLICDSKFPMRSSNSSSIDSQKDATIKNSLDHSQLHSSLPIDGTPMKEKSTSSTTQLEEEMNPRQVPFKTETPFEDSRIMSIAMLTGTTAKDNFSIKSITNSEVHDSMKNNIEYQSEVPDPLSISSWNCFSAGSALKIVVRERSKQYGTRKSFSRYSDLSPLSESS